jgi:hypothetical protein
MKKEQLKKVYWKDVRRELVRENLALATIIDNLNPGRNLPLIKVDYAFGESIVEKGKCALLKSTNNYHPYLDLINYSRVPLGVFLNKAAETFVPIKKQIIPIFMSHPGSSIGLFETLDLLCASAERSQWDVTAGARSIFALENNKNSSMNTAETQSLSEHWGVFLDLINSNGAVADWKCSLIFFTKPWIKHLLRDQSKGWLDLREYLFRETWLQAESLLDRTFSCMWQQFFVSTLSHDCKPGSYITETLKHLFRIACSLAPGFVPATTDLAAPVSFIKQICHDSGLSQNQILMIPANIRQQHDAVYYSLAYNTTPDFYVNGDKESDRVASNFKELMLLVKNIRKRSEKKEVAANKFIHLVDQINFSSAEWKDFHGVSHFFKSCVQIRKQPAVDF